MTNCQGHNDNYVPFRFLSGHDLLRQYTDRNKAPLPDFKNIEYKPSVSSKDFIKKVSINHDQLILIIYL